MERIKTEEEVAAGFVLERDRRLSESLIWHLQRSYFQNQGIDAWRHGAVPHYITSNPFFAHACARVVLGYLRDAHACGDLILDQPVYLVELGSGAGRFAFYFLKEFFDLLDRSSLPRLAIRYVMTDFASANLEFWRSHPSLQPFVTEGRLDFSLFEVGQSRPIDLMISGKRLEPGAVKNPVVVLANYVFDCVPHDVFYVHNGRLYEGRVAITSSQAEPDLADPELINQIELAYDHQPAIERYGDPDFDRILEDYEQRLGDTMFLFPIAAMRCFRYFQELAAGRFLFLVADKGVHWEEDLLSWHEPDMILHGGSFSMSLNFHALGKFVHAQGGWFRFTSRRYSGLDVAVFGLGAPADAFREARLSFDEAIEAVGPDDYLSLIGGIEAPPDSTDTGRLLAWLRFGRWDPDLFVRICPAMLNRAESMEPVAREQLALGLGRIWDNYYDIGEKPQVSFCLGTLLCAMEYYREALPYLEHSLRRDGPDARTLYNIALCHFNLRDLDLALLCASEALMLDPSCQPAKALQVTIQSTQTRQARGQPDWRTMGNERSTPPEPPSLVFGEPPSVNDPAARR